MILFGLTSFRNTFSLNFLDRICNRSTLYYAIRVFCLLLLLNLLSINTAVSNDICTNATLLTCGSTLENESTSGSTDNGDITGCSLGVGVWYKVLGNGMVMSVTATPEANFDIGLSVSSGTNCNNYTNLNCVDNESDGGSETISFVSENGLEYYLYVGEFSNMGIATGSFDILLQCTSLPSNYTCESATLLSCGSFLENEVTIGSMDNGDIIGCDLGTGVWYKFNGSGLATTIIVNPDSGYDPGIRITSSTNCSIYNLIACVDDESDGTPETYSFTSIQGTNYYIYVGDYYETGITEGSFSLSLSCSALPTNYTCVDANVLSCGSNLIKLSTVGSEDNGDITGCNIGTGVWHKIIGTDQEVTVTAVPAAGFDIEMSISKSADCSIFSSIVCSDQGGEGEAESATFTTRIGDDYYIYIGDYFSSGNEVGTYAINVTCNSIASPPNDNCSSAIYMQCGDIETVNTFSASSETLPLCPGGGNTSFSNTAWFRVAGTGGMLTIATCASLDDYSQVIQLYTGDCFSGFSCAGNSMSNCSGTLPEITFSSVSGTEYYVMIGVNGTGSGGQLSVELTCATCASNGNLVLTPPNNFDDGDTYNFTTNELVTADNLIGMGATISFNGKKGILLDQNFEVSLGATLEADTSGCP